MELTEEIIALLAMGPEQVSEVELTYRNGGKVRGVLRKFNARRGKLLVQKLNPSPGERPRHRVVFDHVTLLKITLADGSEKGFD